MHESMPVTLCGQEAGDCFVVTEDFLTVPADRRCSRCFEAVGAA
jgi:hypothetical protein